MAVFLKLLSAATPRCSPSLALGNTLRIGRALPSDFVVDEDETLSRVHFEVKLHAGKYWLRDLGSKNGTRINGSRISLSPLQLGDVIHAGRSQFSLLQAEQGSPVAGPKTAPAPELNFEALLRSMRKEAQPLYAVLDTARDPAVLKLLLESQQSYHWLFEGDGAPALMHFAPYLVPLPPDSPLLEPLVLQGWKKSWGVYLSSAAPAAELSWHLRRLLVAALPDGTRALLRFYDPRILRVLASTSTAAQLQTLFGPVRMLLASSEDGENAVVFSQTPQGLQTAHMPLTATGKPSVQVTPAVPAPYAPGSANTGCYALRKDQADLLASKQRNGMQDDLLADVTKFKPAESAKLGPERLSLLVQHGCHRAPQYGLRTQAEIRDYLLLMLRLGPNFDADPRLPWAKQILGRRLKPAEKLAKLKAAASQHQPPAPSAAPRTKMLPGAPRQATP